MILKESSNFIVELITFYTNLGDRSCLAHFFCNSVTFCLWT